MPEREIGVRAWPRNGGAPGIPGRGAAGVPGEPFQGWPEGRRFQRGRWEREGGIRRASALECGCEAARRGPRVAVRTRGI